MCRILTICPLGKFTIFCRLLIFSKSNFLKNSFRNTIRVSNSLIQIRPDILSGQIWFQNFCKGFQQTTVGGIELNTDQLLDTPFRLNPWLKSN